MEEINVAMRENILNVRNSNWCFNKEVGVSAEQA